MWKGCAANSYYYSELSKSESWTDYFLRPDPFGFYWRETKDYGNKRKLVYQNCDKDELNFIEHNNGEPDSPAKVRLSNLTFYNIKPKTRSLDDVKLHLSKSLSNCKQFEEYLRNNNNILNGYIYFSRMEGNPKVLEYYAMEVNLYGPEDSREKAYLLAYQTINSTHKGFSPVNLIELFERCQKTTSETIYKNDSLIFALDSDERESFYIELKDLLFYDEHSYTQGPSGIEMKTLKKISS